MSTVALALGKLASRSSPPSSPAIAASSRSASSSRAIAASAWETSTRPASVELRALAGAVEQLHPDLALERRDLLADRRLREVERRRPRPRTSRCWATSRRIVSRFTSSISRPYQTAPAIDVALMHQARDDALGSRNRSKRRSNDREQPRSEVTRCTTSNQTQTEQLGDHDPPHGPDRGRPRGASTGSPSSILAHGPRRPGPRDRGRGLAAGRDLAGERRDDRRSVQPHRRAALDARAARRPAAPPRRPRTARRGRLAVPHSRAGPPVISSASPAGARQAPRPGARRDLHPQAVSAGRPGTEPAAGYCACASSIGCVRSCSAQSRGTLSRSKSIA